MLFAALFFSAILLVAANRAAVKSQRPAFAVFFWGAALSVIPFCIGILIFSVGLIIPEVPILAVVFCILLSVTRWRFLPLSLASFVIVFVISSIPAIEREFQYAKWREQYPFESIEERLPLQSRRIEKLREPSDMSQSAWLESAIENSGDNSRSRRLELLHERTVSRFVNSYGFGVGRMVRTVSPTESGLVAKRDDQPIPQPKFSDARASSGDKVRTPFINDSAMSELHQAGILDFVYPDGFGYFKDRRNVAGFQSHRFSKVPDPEGKVQVVSIELIGWLRGAPRAYVSENLPAMQELRNAPTRPLDIFEEEGLAELRGGKDIVVKDRDLGIRVLGSIRATKQCIDCHGGERGNLLGAFSYRLR